MVLIIFKSENCSNCCIKSRNVDIEGLPGM